MCNGHASECSIANVSAAATAVGRHHYNYRNQQQQLSSKSFQKHPKCACAHNTCGNSCDQCCPLFNQKRWRSGTKTEANICEECQCHGHAKKCVYDQAVADRRASLNKRGQYEGGGVCQHCEHHTTGINCEQCEDRYYRPEGVAPDAERPCVRCRCSGLGTSELCVKDDTHLIEGKRPGDCVCKEGFDGSKCDRCSKGYKGYPRCEQCTCVYAGITNKEVCDGVCHCKVNVLGARCNLCRVSCQSLFVNL